MLVEGCSFYMNLSALIRENSRQLKERLESQARQPPSGWTVLGSTWGTWMTPSIRALIMIVLALIFSLYVLKFLSNLLQQRVQALTSSTITQLLLTEDYQPLRVLEPDDPKKPFNLEKSRYL